MKTFALMGFQLALVLAITAAQLESEQNIADHSWIRKQPEAAIKI